MYDKSTASSTLLLRSSGGSNEVAAVQNEDLFSKPLFWTSLMSMTVAVAATVSIIILCIIKRRQLIRRLGTGTSPPRCLGGEETDTVKQLLPDEKPDEKPSSFSKFSEHKQFTNTSTDNAFYNSTQNQNFSNFPNCAPWTNKTPVNDSSYSIIKNSVTTLDPSAERQQRAQVQATPDDLSRPIDPTAICPVPNPIPTLFTKMAVISICSNENILDDDQTHLKNVEVYKTTDSGHETKPVHVDISEIDSNYLDGEFGLSIGYLSRSSQLKVHTKQPNSKTLAPSTAIDSGIQEVVEEVGNGNVKQLF